ncbi:MAG: hypothetical protein ABI120_08750 [Gemmatimonadaceae bacterium]
MNADSRAKPLGQTRQPTRSNKAIELCQLLLVAAASTTSVLMTSSAWAQQPRIDGVTIDGRYRGGEKVKLMVDFVKGTAGDSITEILTRDLRYSDRYDMLPAGSAPGLTGAVNYALFAQLGAQGVVEASVLPSGTLHVELHDVSKQLLMQKQDFLLPGIPGNKDWRMAVHGASDQIEQWITGQRGIAQSRIAYVRDNRIWMVDSDGANAGPVNSRGVFPKWTPNGRAIVYNLVEADFQPIMLMDVATGAQKTLTNLRASDAGDVAPVVTSDGRTVIFGRNSSSGTDLFSVPLAGGPTQRLTNTRGKSSGSPTVSPDGLRMAFSSDRAGMQNVYVADIDGSNVEVLTQGGVGERNWRDGADWSPDGRLIAYQSGVNPSFQIMIVNVRDQTTKFVTGEGKNIEPSWAPDSRHLVASSARNGLGQQLWVIDTQTGSARQLTRGSLPRAPAWSPRLTGTP